MKLNRRSGPAPRRCGPPGRALQAPKKVAGSWGRRPLCSQPKQTAFSFTMLGPGAGEGIATVQTSMLGGFPYTRLGDFILTHPTMAEGLIVLFANVPARTNGLSGTRHEACRTVRPDG